MMFSCMRACISTCVSACVVVVVGMKGLGACFLSVVTVDCLVVDFWLVNGDIFELGGNFVVVVVEVETFEVVLEHGLRLDLWCSNRRGIYCDVIVMFEFVIGRKHVNCR